MIEKVTLNNIPCFPDNTEISQFRAINYFYGANGTGKTSISRVLASPDKYGSSCIDWGATLPIPIYVYNRDFVDKNFTSKIRGIFTLGDFAEASKEIDKLVAVSTEGEKRIAKEKGIIDGDNTQIGLVEELTNEITKFENDCWQIRQRMPAAVQSAYSPHQGSKTAFATHLLSLFNSETIEDEPPSNLEELKKDAEAFLTQSISPINTVSYPDFMELYKVKGEEILFKRIIGKSDVSIAGIIQKLQNADWVRKGRGFIDEDARCPFCQQALPASFTHQLEEYFDESFEQDVKALEGFETSYQKTTSSLIESIAQLKKSNIFIDDEKIDLILERVSGAINNNLQAIADKKRELGSQIRLDSFDEHLTALKAHLDSVNRKIIEHNKVVANLDKNRKTLKKNIWLHTASLLKHSHSVHIQSRLRLESSIKEKNELIKELTKSNEYTKNKIKELERSRTGIEASVAVINNILEKFGFSNFSIKSSDTELGYYTLVRSDGSSAHGNLSEGEKTFITFLYFYQLLMGSHEESGITDARIVVIDDPISSLDSEVLFIVNELIRKLVNSNIKKDNPGNIKQFFILTHNVYFFKEVSYEKNPPRKNSKRSYYIIRKGEGASHCQFYNKNPIENSYSLLWRELAENSNNITTQNILRRILEIYFQHFGNYNNLRHLAESFEEKSKIIFNSLVSWSNDGSHSIYDDLYITRDEQEMETYKKVFKNIFYESGHGAHYVMMYNKYHDEKIEEVEQEESD